MLDMEVRQSWALFFSKSSLLGERDPKRERILLGKGRKYSDSDMLRKSGTRHQLFWRVEVPKLGMASSGTVGSPSLM